MANYTPTPAHPYRTQLITEAVVAGYIQELFGRARPSHLKTPSSDCRAVKDEAPEDRLGGLVPVLS